MYSSNKGKNESFDALYRAVEDGDVIEIKNIVEMDGLSSSLRNGLISEALLREKEDVARFLIEHESKEQRHNGDVTFGTKETPLHLACKAEWKQSLQGKNMEIAKLLLENGAQIDAQDYLWRTPLHYCRDIRLARILLDKGAAIDVRDESGLTPLIRMLSNKRDAAFIRSCFELIDEYGVKPEQSEQYSLLEACVGGGHDDDGFRELFEHGIDAKARSDSGQTVLHYAVQKRRASMVRVLKHYGIDVNAVDDNGHTLIHTLLDTQELFAGDDLGVLLRDNPEIDLNIEDNNSRTPLLIVIKISKRTTCRREYDIRDRRYYIIKRLLRHGADVFMPMSDGLTAFEKATRHPQRILFDRIARQGLMKIVDKNGNTALHAISESRASECLDDNLIFGLDINVVNKSGETPLQLASKAGRAETVEFFLIRGAGKLIDGRTIDGLTALHIASVQVYDDNEENDEPNFTEVIARHLAQGLNIDARDKLGKTSLHYAVESGRICKVKQLLDNGADVNAADNIGKNSLYRAIESGSPEILKLLLDRGVDVTARFFDGTTSLHLAIRLIQDSDAHVGHVFVISGLLEHFEKYHLNPDLLQKYDIHTPLYYAMQISPSVAERLIRCGASIDKICWIDDARFLFTFLRLNYYKALATDQMRPLRDASDQLLMRLRVANVIGSGCYPKSSLNDKEAKYKENCQEEVEKLRKCKISDQMSYYELLHNADPSSAKAISNIDPDKLNVNFPIYAGLIKGHIEADLYRISLLQSATDKLSCYLDRSSYLRSLSIPVEVISRILEFLDDHDLLRISRPDIWKKSVLYNLHIDEYAFRKVGKYIFPIDSDDDSDSD